MGTLTLPIDTYTIGITRDASGARAVVNVSTAVLSHGIQNRAAVSFRTGVTSFSGAATNVGGQNFNGVAAIVEAPFGDFDRIHALLRDEGPVSLLLVYKDVESTTKPLTGVSFFTGPEPVGEGPADRSPA